MSTNNEITDKTNFKLEPGIPAGQKYNAVEFNKIKNFQNEPIQKLTTLDDSNVLLDGSKSYSNTIVETGSTRTITAAASGHLEGNIIKARYQFDLDCTITLANFDTTGNQTGIITPIPAGTYDFNFTSNASGINLKIKQNQEQDLNLWYVNTNGNDDWPGSANHPFETLQVAIDATTDEDVIVIQNIYYSSTEAISLDKIITFRGPSGQDQGISFPVLGGIWTIGSSGTPIFENVVVTATFSSSSSYSIEVRRCRFDPAALPSRLTSLIVRDCYYEVSTGCELQDLIADDCDFQNNVDLKIGRRGEFRNSSVEGNVITGIDQSGWTTRFRNSSVEGDVTVTGNLSRINSVIIGVVSVSLTDTIHNQSGLLTKIIEIGDWDMDANASPALITHGVDITKIREIQCLIINDSDAVISQLDRYTSGGSSGIVSVVLTNIILSRTAAGEFDNTDYDTTPKNRGWVTIKYVL